MSIAHLEKKLRGLIVQQGGLLDQMVAGPPILRGSFSRVHTRCGKPNCWCAQTGKGHAHARITWSQKGRLTTRKVPEDYLDGVRQLTASYRRFRNRRRRLMDLLGALKLVLLAYEEARIECTRKSMPFLASTSFPPRHLPTRRPNRRPKH